MAGTAQLGCNSSKLCADLTTAILGRKSSAAVSGSAIAYGTSETDRAACR
ncbi:MAG TPA: hypothetical protein V6D14_03885 [Coleofasciculaceae cyanobacterium]